MSLDAVIGQDDTIGILRGILRKGFIAHCYLFSGEDGVGKTLAAHEFAKALICREAEADSCGVCSACCRIDSGIHPDVHVIGGEERQIKIDQVRLIETSLSRKSFEGGLKVVVVKDAETMNPAAANAFLKTLEEPPDSSILILVSSRSDLLPETIRSRAQKIRFYPLPRIEIEKILAAQAVPDAALRAMLSEGRLNKALDPDLCRNRNDFLKGLEMALRGTADADQLWKDRRDIDEWFDHAIVWGRDLMVYKSSGNSSLLINADQEAAVRSAVEQTTLKALSKLLSELFRLRQLLRFNLNKQLTFQHILMQFRSVLR